MSDSDSGARLAEGCTKIENINIKNLEYDSELNSSTSRLIPTSDPYTQPSAQLNGNVSYLQDLEDLPQGRHLGLFSTIVLFISRILGSGIFSISAGIYEDCGRSAFLFFLSWIIAAVLAFSGLYVYLELGSLVPRSGGAKVFLEFIYEKPAMLASVAFSVYSVIFGFTISNALVFGEYFLHSIGVKPTDFQTRITGLIFLYFAAVIHGVSVSHGVRIQNILGALKLLLLFAMIITGIYSVLFPQSITDIESNLHWDDFFKIKTSLTSSTFASSIIKASFAFGGWNAVHTVSSEIKDPVRTFKIAGPVSLSIISISYLFINLAYLVVIPEEELINSGKLVGSLLFEKVFGYRVGKQFLTFSVALCAGGNVFVVIYTISRVSQEVFREGYLPFSRIMASNWPFGAPLATLILSSFLTTLVILISPEGDIYNYIIALEGYPNQVFIAFTAFGIFVIRKRYPEIKAPIRSSLVGTVLVLIITLYLVISPFISKSSPNPKGTENWPSYAVVAVLCLIVCIAYWFFMFKLFPWLFNYTLVQEELQLDDGLIVKRWIRVYGRYSG